MEIGSTEWSKLIIDGARVFDLDLERRHTDLFAAHARALLHWTKTSNLTTITDPFEVAVNHFVDSLAPAGLITPEARLLDIGSGGGFPGITLKVAIPALEVTLIDASRKKVNFLKHVIRTLRLEGIEALHIRAEDLAVEPAFMKRFEYIVSRALTDLRSFVRYGLPLLSKEGVLIALKGRVDPTEVEKMGGVAVVKYKLPFTQSHRALITIRKSI